MRGQENDLPLTKLVELHQQAPRECCCVGSLLQKKDNCTLMNYFNEDGDPPASLHLCQIIENLLG